MAEAALAELKYFEKVLETFFRTVESNDTDIFFSL